MSNNFPGGGTLTATVIRVMGGLAAIVIVTLAGFQAWLGAEAAIAVLALGAVLLAAIAAVAWLMLDRLAGPVDRLALDLAVIARDNPDLELRVGQSHWLDRLIAGIEGLRGTLTRARQGTAQALAEATAHAEEQRHQLEAILLDLSESIIVCNLRHQILLYNPAAAALLEQQQTLGLGRSLFTVLAQEPILHALERLEAKARGAAAAGERFVCATVDGRQLVLARMGAISDAEKGMTGYVLVMRDVGAEVAAMAQRDDLLLSATEGFRAPVANLRAAAETLAANPDMAPSDRVRFEKVLLEESTRLSSRVEGLAEAYRHLGSAQWFMAEIYSTDLLASLRQRLARLDRAPTVIPVGLPGWLYGDSLSLLVLLEQLVMRLRERLDITTFYAEVTLLERRVYLDLIWTGETLPPVEIDSWLDVPLVGGLGPLTGRAVLQRHGSDIWCQPGSNGEARLRMPLPSAQPVVRPPVPRRPPRPEFYDFDLLRQPLPAGEMASRPLRQVNYVVLDLETTGLRPSEGDEVVALAAVRVVNGRVLTTETFERLVNPGRSIPPESTRIHGITDDQVKDKPPFSLVLPQFRDFAADAVLVAHNAAFDLTFIHRTAEACGIRFDQAVLDTLLLSAHLDPDEPDHSLDGIAARLGLVFERRHSALGDCLVTAAILVRLIERLEKRGFRNLRDVIKATGMTAEIRSRQRNF